MAVSKRTRYEVLRRDDFTCRYCRSKDNELHVDHVTPVSLGGTDKPDNLVAACKDCNLGKASSGPDAATLDHLDEQTIAYEKARAAVVARETKKAKAKRKVYKQVTDTWETCAPRYAELAPDWRTTVTTWIGRGLPVERVLEAFEIACGKTHLPDHAIYPYACKIAWNWITDLENAIRAEASADQPDPGPDDEDLDELKRLARSAWDAGRNDVHAMYQGEIVGGAILRHHIDGTAHHVPEAYRYARAA